MLESVRRLSRKNVLLFSLISFSAVASAQDNSPYSRFGLGDQVPPSNITTRGLGGVSAAYNDAFSINFNNPASYSQFQVFMEQRSKKLQAGRVIFDVGINVDNRTLVQPNTTNRFSTSNLLFSYLQVGVPLKRNWGLSFGLRPLNRISYMINRSERLIDPSTQLPIDSAITQFRGSGGSFLPTIGTGFAIGNFSAGANVGYLFGNRENQTLRSLVNDTVLYYSSEHSTNSSFGGLFFNAGMLYRIPLGSGTSLQLGATGNWEQKINASRDVLRQTFTRGTAGEIIQIDSVYQKDDERGELVYPASYKFGFVLQRVRDNFSGWLVGADFTTNKWDGYRFFGERDSVQSNWQVNVGAQFNPRPKENYFSQVVYRFGFFTGPDYIRVQNKMPVFGGSFGMALPIRTRTQLTRNQINYVNLALEYIKRGNDDNRLKENLFRISVGFNLTDLWFGKPRYE